MLWALMAIVMAAWTARQVMRMGAATPGRWAGAFAAGHASGLPKCAGICPANAFVIREDGIVILDETRCMGCCYCAWGCPYDVPQHNPEARHMSKCDLCYDQLDQGLRPACVAACRLRTLDYRETTAVPLPATSAIRLWEVSSDSHPYPLPAYSHTQPRLAIQPHPGMLANAEKTITNREEIQPRKTSSWEERCPCWCLPCWDKWPPEAFGR